jgi:threonyl-tRNA synthetase
MKTGKSIIINAAADKGLSTVIEYGEAAFMVQVGFHGKRCFGRQWQLGTIQVDYNTKFDLTYEGSDNELQDL